MNITSPRFSGSFNYHEWGSHHPIPLEDLDPAIEDFAQLVWDHLSPAINVVMIHNYPIDGTGKDTLTFTVKEQTGASHHMVRQSKKGQPEPLTQFLKQAYTEALAFSKRNNIPIAGPPEMRSVYRVAQALQRTLTGGKP